MKNPIKLALAFIAACSLSTACKKENQGVPYVPVNITMYVTDPQFVNLNAVGGWVYITGGYRGILLYRKSQTEFAAYERACTFDPENTDEYVKMDANNIEAVDSHCGSRFLITDGSVTQGPAGVPLKTYQTHFDGTVLTIYN
ncbi:MAG: hypothetical protein FD123_4216 [Bacteroidetes bacterium]|nr:MAG: hypothetical protein FD123_4216 [Bacteroidota bacterium]